MSDPHRVTVTELEQVTRRILDQVRREIGEVVDLSADHYWITGTTDRFDLTKIPEPMAGQLGDDVASIRECLSAPEVVLWHDLQHLTGVLLRLAALGYPTVP